MNQGVLGEWLVTRERDALKESSSIRTLTVGYGITPYLLSLL
jgi:hypothetical protein